MNCRFWVNNDGIQRAGIEKEKKLGKKYRNYAAGHPGARIHQRIRRWVNSQYLASICRIFSIYYRENRLAVRYRTYHDYLCHSGVVCCNLLRNSCRYRPSIWQNTATAAPCLFQYRLRTLGIRFVSRRNSPGWRRRSSRLAARQYPTVPSVTMVPQPRETPLPI